MIFHQLSVFFFLIFFLYVCVVCDSIREGRDMYDPSFACGFVFLYVCNVSFLMNKLLVLVIESVGLVVKFSLFTFRYQVRSIMSSKNLNGTSSSSGKRLTDVSTATWIRIPATGKLTFRYRQGQRTDTWQHVTSLDHFCGARIPLYNSKKKIACFLDMNHQLRTHAGP